MTYQPKTITEYLANEYVENGGEVNTKDLAEVITEGIYENLQLDDVDLSKNEIAKNEFESIQDHIQEMLDEMMPDAEAVVRDWGDE